MSSRRSSQDKIVRVSIRKLKVSVSMNKRKGNKIKDMDKYISTEYTSQNPNNSNI